jgi:hypothetical protein
MSAQRWIILLSALSLFAGASCRRAETFEPQGVGAMPGKTIEQVQQEHTKAWMAMPGVVGTAIGQCKGKPCILIFTASNPEQVRRKIPSTVEGYPVLIQHTGEIRALDTP